ncbi:MAG: SMC-Scp complex subunit ScpB [Planctomycetales bacterium]|nr:SMC-Scp complex subunit ScpB [Planctomycetales bacterium]
MIEPRVESSGEFEGEEDPGLSLDELSQAYAELVGGGEDPYDRAPPVSSPDGSAELFEEAIAEEQSDSDVGCEISPQTILEAMLFVGHPENHPLTSRQVAAMMRGVLPREIDELVEELNRTYESEGAPYWIESVESGYVMRLREFHSGLRDRFLGRVKAAKLSQPALDVLAIVAYHQGVTREEVDELRSSSSGALLRQLVRRQLLRLERPNEPPRAPRFYTTDRFLDLVGIANLDELPQSE